VLKAESESSDLSQKTFLIKARGITTIHMKLSLRGTTIHYTYPDRFSENISCSLKCHFSI